MPQLKLTYFSAPGRAEMIRLVLTFAGLDFEDERISFPELSKRKTKLPYGSLPVLEIDGTVYSQSQALLHYVGRLAKLYPDNDALKALKIDQIIYGFEDIGAHFASALHLSGKDKLAAHKEIAKNILPRYLGGVEKLIEGKGYSVGDELTIADFVVYSNVKAFKSGSHDGIPTYCVDGYPKIMSVFNTLDKFPKLKAWNAAH